MIKCIIFDFDGTLADSRAVFISVYNKIAIKHQFRQISCENIDHLRALTISQRCRYLGVPMIRIPFLAGEFLNSYQEALHEVTIFKGIKPMLETLNDKGFETAIISSNAEINIIRFLEDNGITTITRIYSSTSLFGKEKLINRFRKKYGLTTNQILYVGDESRDIVASKRAGVKVAGVTWGYDTEHTIINENPDYILRKPGDLLRILD